MAKKFRGGLMPLIFFFVLCCGLMACVFARAADLSVRAEQLNSAVQICRNGVEIFTAQGSTGEVQDILGGPYFTLDGERAWGDDAALCLHVQEQDLGLRQAVFTVTTLEGEEVYSLTAWAAYGGGGGHG